MTRCTRCPANLDTAAILGGFDYCTDCERRQLDAEIAEALRLKSRGQAQASAAHPDERARVERAIRQLAATGKPFSANDARPMHGVIGGVVGSTFTALRKAGVIERVGRVTSSGASAHAHEIGKWRGVAA